MISYGCGAKLIKGVTEVSECFAISKDIFHPFHHSVDKLVSDYESLVTSVELALPAN